MTKTKDLSKFAVNTRREKFYPTKENTLLPAQSTVTRCTMKESRLNDLALIALHPYRLSELSTEKIIEMFVQANPKKLKLKRVGEYVD